MDYAPIQMIAVGTPAGRDGAADLQYVLAVVQQIAGKMRDFRLIVHKSTVPVGTADQIKLEVKQILKAAGRSVDFDVASNPEFLREGSAINDFLKPDRIICGVNSTQSASLLRSLYLPLIDQGSPFLLMTPRSAELCKYAANALLATKVSFMNEMAELAEAYGASIEEVKQGMGHDPRIGNLFLEAGCGFGGSCFPKDIKALQHLAVAKKLRAPLLDAVLEVNHRAQRQLFEKLRDYFKADLKGRIITIWGLAFKPHTDDIRCATALVLIDLLKEQGAVIQAYDPLAIPQVAKWYKDDLDKSIRLCRSPEEALLGAQALLVVTEWPEFGPQIIDNFSTLQVILDGRGVFRCASLPKGIDYYGIGDGWLLKD